jgi:NADH-quinone oxidoreductase subunit A
MTLDAYLPLILFALIALGIVVFLLTLSHLRSKGTLSFSKNLPYECGFDPLEDKMPTLNVRFYLVGLLFIIFDVEIIFLFPWALTLGHTGFLGFCSMALFLFLLTIGFIYEWVKGALSWT